MNKNLRKKICTRYRLGINFCKNSTKENEKSPKYNEINVYHLEGKILRNI